MLSPAASAGAQRRGNRGQQLPLQGGALLNQLFAVLGKGGGFFVKHPLAAAGRIDQNAVKKTAKSLPQMFSRFIEHNHIRRAHALDI